MQQDLIQGFRLSPQQKHLWQLQQSAPAQPFRARCAVKIEGALNPEIFERAIGYVSNEHEILRTTFRLLPGMTIPLQVIADTSEPSLEQHDLSELADEARDLRILELFEESACRAIDFARLPTLRCDLIKLSP